MPDDDAGRWEGDVNEAVVAEWTAETTPFERVQSVLRSTSTAQYAGEIGDRARVSEPTARNHLQRLVQTGHATTVETTRGIRYRRSRQTVALERIAELHRDLTREELVDGIRRLRAEITDIQDRYDATDPDDLAIQIETDDVTDAWTAVTEWRSLEENLDVAKAALALYDFDPDTEGDSGVATSPERGSFGRSDTDAGGSDATETA